MFDAARVQQETGACFSPPLRSLTDRAFRDAGDLSSLPGIPIVNVFGNGCETHSVFADEFVVQPIVFDHQVQDAVEERDVASRFDWQKEVAGAGNRSDARIDDDDLGPILARLPNIVLIRKKPNSAERRMSVNSGGLSAQAGEMLPKG